MVIAAAVLAGCNSSTPAVAPVAPVVAMPKPPATPVVVPPVAAVPPVIPLPSPVVPPLPVVTAPTPPVPPVTVPTPIITPPAPPVVVTPPPVVIPPAPPVVVDTSATLSWVAPTTNTDGTPVTPLSGFRIYYGATPTTLSVVVDVPGAVVAEYEIANLSAGTWYFAITALAVDGTESALSSVVSKEIM